MVALRIKSNNVLRNIMSDRTSHNDESTDSIPKNKETKAFSNVSKLQTYDTYDSSYDQPKTDYKEQFKTPEKQSNIDGLEIYDSTPVSTKEKLRNFYTDAKDAFATKKVNKDDLTDVTYSHMAGLGQMPEARRTSIELTPVSASARKEEFAKTFALMGKGARMVGQGFGNGITGSAKFLAGKDPEHDAAIQSLTGLSKTAKGYHKDYEMELFNKHGVKDVKELSGKISSEEREKLNSLAKQKDTMSYLLESKQKELPKRMNTPFSSFATNVSGNIGANIGGFTGSFNDKNTSSQARYAQANFRAIQTQYLTKKKAGSESELLSKLGPSELKRYLTAKKTAAQAININSGSGFMGGQGGRQILEKSATRRTPFTEFTQVGRSGPPELGMFNPETSSRFDVNQTLRSSGQNKIASILGKAPDTGLSARDKLKRFI